MLTVACGDEVFGGWGSIEDDGNAASLDFERSGVVFGADWGARDHGLIGIAVGYRESNADENDRASSGDVRSLDAGLYGGVRAGAVALSGQLGGSWRDIGTTRHVTIGMLSETLSADYEAQSLYAQVRAGVPVGDAHASLEPFVALAYVNVDTDGFTEEGGASALTVEDSTQNATFATLGLSGMLGFGPDGRDGGMFASLGYRHADGDLNASNTMAYASNPGVSFDISGAPIAEESMAVEAGLRLPLSDHINLSAAYRGDFGDESEEQGVNLRIELVH